MQIEFATDELRRLYEDPTFRLPRFGADVIKAYRKKVGLLADAHDERDLFNMRSLHYKKLVADRTGQHSIRLNDQWRLILRVTTADDKTIIVVEVVDYH
jgi:proteic killer suppression protein